MVKQNPPVEYYYGPEIDRQTAHSLGRVRYFTGEPCKWGHIEERWVSSGTCVQCRMERNRTPEYREYATPKLAEWTAANPDKVDSYNAQRNAKGLAKPVKSEARRAGLLRHWEERRNQD